MPYYSRSKRRTRRPTRRGTYKRRKAFKRSNNQGVTNFKLKQIYSVSSDSFGALLTTTQVSSVVSTPEWGSIQGLYDSFKVIAIKKELMPYSVGNESSSVGANVRGNLGSYVDMDGTGLPANIGGAIEYNSFKMVSSRSKQSRYLRIPKDHRTQINDMGLGFDTDNKNCTIVYQGDNFGVSQLQYWVVDTFYVQVQGRR